MRHWEEIQQLGRDAEALASAGRGHRAVRLLERALDRRLGDDRGMILVFLVEHANAANMRDAAVRHCTELMQIEPHLPLVRATRARWLF